MPGHILINSLQNREFFYFWTMAKKRKYYVIWRGHETGVFDSWNTVQNLIRAYPNASYKSFPDRASAEEAYHHGPSDYIGKDIPKKSLSAEEKRLIGEPVRESLAVDAACSGNPGTMEYQGVWVKTGECIFYQGPYPEGTVNIGEFLALVHGLAFLKKKNYKMPIYSDSRTALSWVRKKKANTKLEQTANNKKLFELIERAEYWLKTNTCENQLLKWETGAWGEIPADFGRK